MTPKEKALDIVDRITTQIFDSGCTVSKPMVKQIALLCVNEVVKSRSYIDWTWVQIKKEIESL